MEALAHWFDHVVGLLVAFVEHLGVAGIFIMTFLESTFMPIPSEITMIPAGYLIQQGKMDLWSVLIASIVGTIGGGCGHACPYGVGNQPRASAGW